VAPPKIPLPVGQDLTGIQKLQANGHAELDAGVDVYGPSALHGPVTPYQLPGDLAYSSNPTGVPARLPIGTAGQVLTSVGGFPAWAAAGGGGATLLASVATTTVGFFAVLTTDTSGVLVPLDFVLQDPHGLLVPAKKSFVVPTAGLWAIFANFNVAPNGGGNWAATATTYITVQMNAATTTDGNAPALNASNWLDSFGAQMATLAFFMIRPAANHDPTNDTWPLQISGVLKANAGSAIGCIASIATFDPNLQFTINAISIALVG